MGLYEELTTTNNKVFWELIAILTITTSSYVKLWTFCYCNTCYVVTHFTQILTGNGKMNFFFVQISCSLQRRKLYAPDTLQELMATREVVNFTFVDTRVCSFSHLHYCWWWQFLVQNEHFGKAVPTNSNNVCLLTQLLSPHELCQSTVM